MVDIISCFLAFAFIGALLVFSFRSMDKEKREIKRYRENVINCLEDIAKSIKGE